jgi:dihydroorotate dehydrogenase (fumarate)
MAASAHRFFSQDLVAWSGENSQWRVIVPPGLHIAHPFVAGSSPLGRDLDTIRRLEDGGAAAIVLPSLFEEQVTLTAEGRIRHMDPHEPQWSRLLQHFPTLSDYAFAPDEYAEHIGRVKRAVGIPVIGSLNGTTGESWLKYSRLIQQSGADALELNMYEMVTDPRGSSVAVERELRPGGSGWSRLVQPVLPA